MRSNLSKSEFFLKCKRKPAQQALLDRVDTLTDLEIENCGQPLWVRDALRELAKRGGKTAAMSAFDIALEMEAKHVQSPEVKYPVYEWAGPETVIKPEGRGFELDIKPGDLFLVDGNRGQVKIDYSVMNVNSATIGNMISMGKQLNSMTDREYIEYVVVHNNKRG